MQTKFLVVESDGGWQNANLLAPVSSGESISIISGENSKGIITSYFSVEPNGTKTLRVHEGDEITINASGTWIWHIYSPHDFSDPNGSGDPAGGGFTLPGASKWSLIGRIGTGAYFYIGSSHTFTATGDGVLELLMNDDIRHDNAGALSVKIQMNGFCGLKGKIGSGAEFSFGRNYRGIADDDGDLYLSGDSTFHKRIDVRVVVDAPDKSIQEGNCEFTNIASEKTHNPIQLQTGTKVLSETDLSMQTPAGVLSFARSYNQAKQTDSDYQFMGLGWSHNHLYKLSFSGSSPNRVARLNLPDGGEITLDEDSLNAGTFLPRPGSTSELHHVSGDDEYVLTSQAKNRFHFDDSTLRLKTREWTSNETWSYAYDGSGNLTEVEDGYGRQLRFAYVDNPSQFDDGQLWRVGDHTTVDLDSTPSGPYIEFTYTPEQLDGVTVTTPKALLSTVRDVRGNVWDYHYYGQESGEDDADLGNLLTKRLSPSVDVTGNGTPDGRLTLEDLTYTLSGAAITGIVQKRGEGLITTDFRFQPGGENITTETIVGASSAILELTKTHHFANGVYLGVANHLGETPMQVLDDHYRPQIHADALNHETRLDWDMSGQHLNQVMDALDHETLFDYNIDDTLNFSVDPQGRKTEYSYGDGNNPRLPTRIDVIDVDDITLLRRQELVYDALGRTLEEKVFDPTDGTTIQSKVTRTYGTSGNADGLLESLTQLDLLNPANDVSTTFTYDTSGRILKTQKSSLFGSCEVSYTVYDLAGSVVASICNYDNNGAAPTTAAEAAALYDLAEPGKNRVTTYTYDPLGRRIETVTNAGDGAHAVHAQTTLTVYDALDRVVRTISNYVEDVAITTPFTAAHSAFDHGSGNNANLVTDTAYNARGLVRKQVDVLGRVTLYGYDEADRLVKTVQNASQPSYNNDYDGTPPDPFLANYSANTSADQDIVTTQAYDANGNLVASVDPLGRVSYTVYDPLNRPIKTVRNAKDTATLQFNDGDTGYAAQNDPRSAVYIPSVGPDRDLIETTDYDALGRVIRTRRLMENRPTAIWDVTLYGYDSLGRQVKVIRSASTPTYDLSADPDLGGYTISTELDQDIVTTTSYDTQGRVLYTEDTFGIQTRPVYDGLNRQVRTIANYVDQGEDPAEWIWSSANNCWQKSGGAAIDHGVSQDQNIITETIYDSDGRMEATRDVFGRLAYNVHDSAGWVVRTIINYVPQGAGEPADWVWNNGWKQGSGGGASAVSHGTANDQNVIVDTSYDALGRVVQTVDHRNNVTLSLYDVLGRRVKTITNYLVQGASDPLDWEWNSSNTRWEDGSGNAIDFGTGNDQNRISTNVYDLAGRILRSRDAAGMETRYTYDELGRRTQTITNYENGVYNPAQTDRDLISTTSYNKGGQVVRTIDARGTETNFFYDAAGRRVSVREAVGTPLRVGNYTCYDKAGRILRTIFNCGDPTHPVPDARDSLTGAWSNNPQYHQLLNDRDLITLYEYDRANRQVKVTDPMGIFTSTAYFKDGQVLSVTDAEGTVTAYRYDGMRRRTTVVQGFRSNGEDPALWLWDDGDARWEESDTTPIAHGANHDQNVIVRVRYDEGGRMLSLREPRGSLTEYDYDLLDRRTKLTNPLSEEWVTAYADVGSKTQVTLTDPLTFETLRAFDRLGRLETIQFLGESPKLTPDVSFAYDGAGNRVTMNESDGISTIRETHFGYDQARRLTVVDFDEDGDSSVEQTVTYSYDAGGLRTQLTLPGDLDITYEYDAKGQLIRLTDWDDQATQFAYDNVGRLRLSERNNRLRSQYQYDAGSRLKRLWHSAGGKTLGDFRYEVDRRGNRTQAVEFLPHASGSGTSIDQDDAAVDYRLGTWTDSGDFKVSSNTSASLSIGFAGNEATLTMGTGPDHSLYDIYIDHSYWDSIDGYAASADEREIAIQLTDDGYHTLEVRKRAEKRGGSSGYVVRFKTLETNRTYHLHTIQYSYDALSRLLSADYHAGGNLSATPFESYAYGYDLAGNLVQQNSVARSYNAANQLTDDGTNTLTYDANGNLTDDGVNSYTWDRANRLLSMGGSAYAYDGAGNRISQTVGVNVTQYLLDLQPGLAVVLGNSDGNKYIHAPRGIHAQEDSLGNWTYTLQDGLGSVRSVVDGSLDVLESRLYEPYGTPFGTTGTSQTVYGFTGEQTDVNELVYLRARYYAPSLGVFTGLDPLETSNRYAYVDGHPINRVDPSGHQAGNETPNQECSDATRIRELLQGGFSEINQTPCSSDTSPFGCDNLGQPIPYTRVRNFAQTPYSIASTACPAWRDTDYSNHHCGLDIVSCSDQGLLWANFIDGGNNKVRIRIEETKEIHIYNWSTGRDESAARCLTYNEVLNGLVKFQFNGPATNLGGRKVYAISGGEARWFADAVTLHVNVGGGTKETSLEMQYTHLKACGSANPASLSGYIAEGTLLGCYDKVGYADTPHLHLSFVQRKKDGTPIGANEINDFLCHPEDVYLNPSNPGTVYGFSGLGISSGRSRFPQYLRYGFSATPISNTDWEDALP